MSSTTWHAPPELLATYAAGDLDAVLGASLERHLDSCQQCRDAVAEHGDERLVAEGWTRLRDLVESPALPRPLQLARRCGLPEPAAILLSAALSLRVAWLTSSFLALSFALLATLMSEGTAIWPFLLVAPLVPVLGVAAAYGGAEEPFEALAVTSPYGRGRLVLLRTLAVVVTTMAPAAVLGLFLPGPGWVAVAWLGPALAMVPVLLALAGFIGPWPAGTVVAMAWVPVVLFSARRMPATWPVEAAQQLVYLTIAMGAVAVIVVRSRRARRIGAPL